MNTDIKSCTALAFACAVFTAFGLLITAVVGTFSFLQSLRQPPPPPLLVSESGPVNPIMVNDLWCEMVKDPFEFPRMASVVAVDGEHVTYHEVHPERLVKEYMATKSRFREMFPDLRERNIPFTGIVENFRAATIGE